jgi:hypothetical protein
VNGRGRSGLVAGIGAAAMAAALVMPIELIAQLRDQRYAGLEWTFVRIKYHYITQASANFQVAEEEPWFIDATAAEDNLSRRLKTVTAIQVNNPLILTLDDPKLFEYPWIYFVEPGNLKMTEQDVKSLREFLLRGGTAMFDDFHGPYEWQNFEKEMRRVFPERKVVELQPPHPIFSCFYQIASYPQVPGLGSFFSGRTWEKGGFVPHLRAILDDDGRPMALINWNTDMGDGVEWSNAVEYPGYIKHTTQAYRMFINEILYSLTH